MSNATEEADGPPALFQPERQSEILRIVTELGRVEVSELAERFRVTTETIRRDLSELQEAKLLKRVHGGAVPWQMPPSFEPLLTKRSRQNRDEKLRLARRAIEEVPWNGTMILDSGSTVGTLAELLPNRPVHLITNSLDDAQLMANRDVVDVTVVGGRVRKTTMAMVDADTVASIETLAVDVLFISCDAATPEGGLTTPYRDEAALKTAMIGAANRVVALVDHTKFGTAELIRFARWSAVDLLITGDELDAATTAAIEAAGTRVAVC